MRIFLQGLLGVTLVSLSLPLLAVFGPVIFLVTGLGVWLIYDALTEGLD